MEKNLDHLENLRKKFLITDSEVELAKQTTEELQVEIHHNTAFRLFSLQELSESKEPKLIKLQFFHTWIFYYLYSADHKFLKAILKQKFPFVHHLFAKEF